MVNPAVKMQPHPVTSQLAYYYYYEEVHPPPLPRGLGLKLYRVDSNIPLNQLLRPGSNYDLFVTYQ